MTTTAFVAPQPSMFVMAKVEELQKAAAKAETAMGDASNLPFLTWNRKGKIATARAAYDAAMAELTEAREELAVSRDYEAKMATENAAASNQGRKDAIDAALLFAPELKGIARTGLKEAANELDAVENARKALALREELALEKATAARTLLRK
ncbi:hypothetical protein A3K29_05240 [Candidatus Collierbacteria bacterium RIFOXYB2_FULL_46_14]|uniref:Uncharacterized protein n=1 Tax=Candidatus Collierbacteria bacterium GW2011_GWA2_46_26 TaxID=1618381 RepID=A0A0G1PL08_9BACT|nr:MAG: hypothetical protein UX47_C0004G0066 [Candidatus Collierbacteria bacterium GW2011_GWA2_46_26]OGD73498.1 MAG: hypothetical protein A3K29_05240 [Candidatus Collierbacteria bacterium RIFOXYB2_FULL_46_14]OGD76540.1 MAG: hypothetical protein A3K43_05240 [Candidatus Collierbacteria bacterium RIFOXYA2_FULL_46_20]OGD77876.1 MAG: hypothetical protein A3K39_05240 [Candidatus Collierbacteria bacterium RIFOXYC2_FULL_43_15]OGD81166.1 MAG: hypothetical protein A2320_05735 [Pseudomonadales bacterium G